MSSLPTTVATNPKTSVWFHTVRGVCNFLGSVLLQQKFEATDGPALQPSEGPVWQLLDRPMLQFHLTTQFYLESKGKYFLETQGNADPKDPKRREAPAQFWLLFLLFFFFLLPLGLSYVNWANQDCCLFYLRSSFWSSELPFFYFHWLFPSLSFSHSHSELFSYSNYLTIPPKDTKPPQLSPGMWCLGPFQCN